MESALIFSIIFFLIIVAISILRISVYFKQFTNNILNNRVSEDRIVNIQGVIIDLDAVVLVQKVKDNYIRVRMIDNIDHLIFCENEKKQQEMFDEFEDELI